MQRNGVLDQGDTSSRASEILGQVLAQTSRTDTYLSSLPRALEQTDSTPLDAEIPDIIPESQQDGLVPETQLEEVIPETQLEELIPETQLGRSIPPLQALPAKKKRAIVQETPSKRRKVLEEIDPDQERIHSFSPVSRAGRKRTLTSKGKENFYVPPSPLV
jgi:hypothetical protein